MKIRETALILVALLLAPSGRISAQSTHLPAGAIALWRGEENAQDAIGANHGTVEPRVTFAPGRIGQAFSFNGFTAVTTASATLSRHGQVWYVRNDYPSPPGAGQDLVMPVPSNPRYLVRAAKTAPRIENPGGSAVGGSEIPAEIAGLFLQGATDGIGLAAPNGAGTVWIHDNQVRGGSGAGLLVVGAPSTKVKLTGGTIEAQAGRAVDVQGAALEIQGTVTIETGPEEEPMPR